MKESLAGLRKTRKNILFYPKKLFSSSRVLFFIRFVIFGTKFDT